MQAPDWLQASGDGSRRQGSGGMVKASRRPRATPPKPPEMYRRPPTAATAWATDSSIGGPTEAWPGERERTGRRPREETHTKIPVREGHRASSERGYGEERQPGRTGKDRKGPTGPGNQTHIAQQKRGRETQRGGAAAEIQNETNVAVQPSQLLFFSLECKCLADALAARHPFQRGICLKEGCLESHAATPGPGR